MDLSQKTFFRGKYLGITEYISQKYKKKQTCMLIYNRELSLTRYNSPAS